jgi:hypothetical protein
LATIGSLGGARARRDAFDREFSHAALFEQFIGGVQDRLPRIFAPFAARTVQIGCHRHDALLGSITISYVAYSYFASLIGPDIAYVLVIETHRIVLY